MRFSQADRDFCSQGVVEAGRRGDGEKVRRRESLEGLGGLGGSFLIQISNYNHEF